MNFKKFKYITVVSTILLQSCSLPQAISYNVTHALGVDAPQSAPSITHEKRKVGNPYSIPNEHGVPIRYTPMNSSEGYREHGIASWYGTDFHAKKTANGEDYNMYAYTAAHKTLPLPTYVRVTNTQNGKSIVVRVNDRGPFYKNRLIDMSYAGAKALGMDKQGTAPVLVEAISIYGGDVNRANRYKPAPKTVYANQQQNRYRTDYANAPQQQANTRYSITRNRSYDNANSANQAQSSSFTNRVVNRNNPNTYKPTAAAAPEVNSSAIASQYYIQLGSFTDVKNARQVYYQAKDLNGIKIKSVPIRGTIYYRVVVENIHTLGQAQQKLQKAKSKGFYNAIIASSR